MSWVIAIVALLYVVYGIAFVTKGGWGDSINTNCKLFLMGCLGWPYIMFCDWNNNREPRGPKIE